MKNLKFVDAKVIGKFGVLNLTRVNKDQIGTFLGAIGKASSEMGKTVFKFQVNIGWIFALKGMVFMRQNWMFTHDTNLYNLEKDMRKAKKDFQDLHLLFVIISRKGDPAYGK